MKKIGTTLLVAGLFVAAGLGMCAWANLTSGLGPAGGHSGLGPRELAGMPFVAYPIAGLIVAVVGAVFVRTANTRRR
jgi:hypothetical protein